jgi:hypothetical protein
MQVQNLLCTLFGIVFKEVRFRLNLPMALQAWRHPSRLMKFLILTRGIPRKVVGHKMGFMGRDQEIEE